MFGFVGGFFFVLSMYGQVLSGPHTHPPYTVLLPHKASHIVKRTEPKPDDLANLRIFTSSNQTSG